MSMWLTEGDPVTAYFRMLTFAMAVLGGILAGVALVLMLT